MQRVFCVLVAGLVWSSTTISSAAVFERDWKTAGDGLLTFDDVNRREWLDPSVSLLSKFPGATLEDRYQNVKLQLQPGGLFEGFDVAKQADVIALAHSAGIDTTTFNYVRNHTAALNLVSLLGPIITFQTFPNGLGLTGGALDDLYSPTSERLEATFQSDQFSAGFLIGLQATEGFPPMGVMMYRSVPEPSTASFALWAGGGLIAIVRQLRCRVAS